ncbi:hypothetical protein P3T76_002407 [Phytophthora citrophthora]|uniref:Uncharacterized protein n=1 Tax=Phytophthora citrophthora TaxID=4793 RepID=A0AAD9GXI0_9STRA|nr:hypothetical protein P3T76_002407 [Phytophthora citrophthora]
MGQLKKGSSEETPSNGAIMALRQATETLTKALKEDTKVHRHQPPNKKPEQPSTSPASDDDTSATLETAVAKKLPAPDPVVRPTEVVNVIMGKSEGTDNVHGTISGEQMKASIPAKGRGRHTLRFHQKEVAYNEPSTL